MPRRLPKAMTKQPAAQTTSSIEDLRTKLAALESEQTAALASEKISEEAWKAALADLQLGEGQKTAVDRTRSHLDLCREKGLGLDGAITEIRRRITAAETAEREAKLAALELRADGGVASLHAYVDELLQLDARAGRVLGQVSLLIEDLIQIKAEHQEIDPEGLGPGRIKDLASRLWAGLRADLSGRRSEIVLAQGRLAEFEETWRYGTGQAPRVLGVKDQTEKKES